MSWNSPMAARLAPFGYLIKCVYLRAGDGGIRDI